MSLNSTDISNISSLSSDFLDDVQSKDPEDLVSADVGSADDNLDLTDDVGTTALDGTASERRDVLSVEDPVTADVDASGFEDDYLDFTDDLDDIDADEENTENTTDPERSDSKLKSSRSGSTSEAASNPWIDAESVTDSLQNLNDHGSILSHFQHLYQVESSKSRQKRRAQVRSSNQQIRSFSLSPKHKMDRGKLLRMKRSKEQNAGGKENKDSNELAQAQRGITDHDGHQLFSAERVHERRFIKRQQSEDKIRAEQVTECTFSPEIDAKSAGLMHEKRRNKSFFDIVEDDIEERKLKADARQRENEELQMKDATFTPKINRADGASGGCSHDYHANCDVFQRLSSHTGSPLLLKTKGGGIGRRFDGAKDRVYNKKRHSKGRTSAALLVSPRRISQMSERLYRNHEKIELKKQVHKKRLEREEEERRASSKVLAHSRKIIVKAFLTKFKQVILGKQSEPREIDNMTCFSYAEIELALTEIGYAQTHTSKAPKSANSNSNAGSGSASSKIGYAQSPALKAGNPETSKIQQLITLLDPDHTNSVRWGDMKRFFSRIAANTDEAHSKRARNRELYQIMQFLYVNKLLKAKGEHGAPTKAAATTKFPKKKWEAQVEKQRRKQQLYEERRAREQRDRANKEMAECTFVPKINHKESAATAELTVQESVGLDDGTASLVDVPRFEQLYEDAQDRKMRHNEKIIERELEHYKEYKSFPFRPSINKGAALTTEQVAAENDPQGFDQAILRMAEGRIRSKQEKIRQQYEQKKMSLQWQKRAKWLRKNKEHKAEADAEGDEAENGEAAAVDEIADALQKVELNANKAKTTVKKKAKRKVKKHTILSATHKLTAKIDALADADDDTGYVVV